MDAQTRPCPICREPDHMFASCAPGVPFTIVLLQIDDETSPQAMEDLEGAVKRAALRLSA